MDVADGKVTTKQMSTRGRLKNAKNVDEFGTAIKFVRLSSFSIHISEGFVNLNVNSNDKFSNNRGTRRVGAEDSGDEAWH